MDKQIAIKYLKIIGLSTSSINEFFDISDDLTPEQLQALVETTVNVRLNTSIPLENYGDYEYHKGYTLTRKEWGGSRAERDRIIKERLE